MPLEDIMVYKDLGLGVVAVIAIYNIAKWTGERTFKEIDNANKYMIDTQNRLANFMETAYKDNTKVIAEFVSEFKDFSRIKDDIAILVKKQEELLDEQKEIIRTCRYISEGKRN